MELKVENINKSFGAKHVLKGINFKAKSGKALGILGRNGAGKTTTIRIIMNVFEADSGKILIDNEKPNYKKLCIGYLPEERGLYPKKKIIEQIVYLAELKGMSKKEAIKNADYWLDRLGMSEYRNKLLETLSKGNQQKIQLITTITPNPDIVILDEPFSGLDPVNSMLLKDVVKELIEKGKIVLFSSHQMNYIEEFCDEIAIIHEGEIVLAGSIKEIIDTYPKNCLEVEGKNIHKIIENEKYDMNIIEDILYINLIDEKQRVEVMSNITQKYEIDSIKVSEPKLNDIFVEYTTRGEN